MGNQPIPAKRIDLGNDGWKDQRNANGTANHGRHLHRLGQQFRGFNFSQHQHHHQRCSAPSFVFHRRDYWDQRCRHQSTHWPNHKRWRHHLVGNFSLAGFCVPLQYRKRLHQRNAECPLDPYPIHDLGEQLWRLVRCLRQCHHQRCCTQFARLRTRKHDP